MMNEYTLSEDGTTATIWLKRRKGDRLACLVDVADLPKLQSLKTTWYGAWCKSSQNFYVRSNVLVGGKRKALYIHRFLLDAPEGLDVDHIHHDPLDNRHCNLEIKTHQANAMNRRGANSHSKTGHRAISPIYGKFVLQVRVNGKQTYIGYYSTIEQALIARDQFPEYARKK